MRPDKCVQDGAGVDDDWEDAEPSQSVAAACDALAVLGVARAGDRTSTMRAVARLQAEGLNMVEAAAVLGLPHSEVVRAMADPRAAVIKKQVAADQSGPDVVAAAQAAFRLERAWEVVTAAMDDGDKWARLQAANMVIAADRAAKEKGPQRIEVVMSPAMVFDDQDLQDDEEEAPEMAASDDSTGETGADGLY